MRALLWTVALVVLATSLDNFFFGGFYTHNFSRMISEIAIYMHIG
jgi:hypothetical protein